jgi:diguanylate cyclase (GGDEF)-like protein/PAS domain S-box-containing protein
MARTKPSCRESAARKQSPIARAVGGPKDAQRVIDEVQARFESAFAKAPIGMALFDSVGRWLEVNESLCRITGYSRDELKATSLSAITHPDDVDLDTQPKRELMEGRIPSYEVEVRYRHARGHYIWVLVTVSLVRDELDQARYVISHCQDISDRKELAERLTYQVDHDFLTGLSNRRRFELELAREAQRAMRYGTGGALLLIDLDNFKDVNDALGHKAGDDLLKTVARELRRRVRETDVLARVGGDEFAVVLPQTRAEEARIVAEGIVGTLRELEVASERSIRVTASVGVALFDGLNAVELLARADAAMYQAKAAGRNRFAMYRGVPVRRGAMRLRRYGTGSARGRIDGTGETMSTRDLTAGRRWVERQFEEIAREFGTPRALTHEDRWREDRTPFPKNNQSMAYYIEMGGHLKRGQVTFRDLDLETAGTGEKGARERLGRQIRDALASYSARRE